MPETKPTRKGAKPRPTAFASKAVFEAQVDSILDALQIVPDEATASAPEQAGEPGGKPAVVSKLIDFIKKM